MDIAAFHSGLNIKRGASLAFMNVLISLKGRGHDVRAYSFQVDGWFEERFREAGIPSTSLDHHQVAPMGVHLILTNNRRARRVFRRLKGEFESADVAYLQDNQWTPHFLPILDMPTVYYCNEPPRHHYEPDLVNVTARKKVGKALGSISRSMDKAADRSAVAHADLICANSDYSREYIDRVYGVRSTTVYLGVDHQVFAPDPATEKEDMVVSVGALYPLKAHDFIIRSLAQVDESIRPRLMLVGHGYQRAELEAMARSSGVDMEVVSEIDTPRLAALYRRAKLTLVAHIREPFGLVSIESQACGTPVVAVGEAGLMETVREDTGILTGRDEREFAGAVDQLLRDDPRRQSMGEEGRAHVVEAFNWERTGVQMEGLLQEAIERHGAGGGS
ncbi:MAG: glycosyltransferase family 4 protein [Thermoplasmata archaeon]|nr:MAG: glycosyltransferase family 4 protein [Thermoplasmata archaeon]